MKHKRQKIVIVRKNGIITAKGNVDVRKDKNYLNLVAMKVRLGEVELTGSAKLRRFFKRLFRSVKNGAERFDREYSGAVAASKDSGIFIPDFLLIGEEHARNDTGN